MTEGQKIREELVQWGKKISERGLVVGPGGNISARLRDIVYIKASGIAFEDATAEEYIGIHLQTGEVVESKLKPSCELLLHLCSYSVREDIRAVVHSHPSLVTGLASAGVNLKPMFPDFIALLGTPVVSIPYIIPAGEELADAVAEKIANHNALLLENHGAITVGVNLKEAYYRTLLLEEAARTLIAATIVGKPRFLNEEEVERIKRLEAEDYRIKLMQKNLEE